MSHYSVMLDECIEGLAIKEDGIYVDATLGRAGHSSEILKRCTKGHLYAFDLDKKAIEESSVKLSQVGNNYTIFHSNFLNMKECLETVGIHKVDGILMDLGVSSPQFDEGDRGFSYRFDARLDMRMNQEQELDAYTIVNTWSYHELVKILFTFGEESNAKLIARGIERQRDIKPIETTFDLVDVIKQSLPMKVLSKKGHPAKKTFQALRIAVNDELYSLTEVLDDAQDLLNSDGRLCVISFHSLEDRIVKQSFAKRTKAKPIDKRMIVEPGKEEELDYRLINRKPILASEQELEENRRSHSAKLRIIERV